MKTFLSTLAIACAIAITGCEDGRVGDPIDGAGDGVGQQPPAPVYERDTVPPPAADTPGPGTATDPGTGAAPATDPPAGAADDQAGAPAQDGDDVIIE